jgi:hypothetical protein
MAERRARRGPLSRSAPSEGLLLVPLDSISRGGTEESGRRSIHGRLGRGRGRGPRAQHFRRRWAGRLTERERASEQI